MWRAKVGSQSDKHTKDKHNISLCLLLKQKLNIFFVVTLLIFALRIPEG